MLRLLEHAYGRYHLRTIAPLSQFCTDAGACAHCCESSIVELATCLDLLQGATMQVQLSQHANHADPCHLQDPLL